MNTDTGPFLRLITELPRYVATAWGIVTATLGPA